MATIVVCGWVASFPTAPFLWHAVSYVLGFQRLGHDVWFLEDSGDDPFGWDIAGGHEDHELHAGARFLAEEMSALGIGDRWVLRHIPTGRHDGLDADTTAEVLAAADVLVNVSLTTPMRPEYLQVPHRLGIDTDPVFTQLRIAHGDTTLVGVPDQHTRLFTFGRPPLPAQAHEWVPTRQPVAADVWPLAPPPSPDAAFSSVLAWQSYPPVEWQGASYGAKDATFAEYLDMPARTGVPLQLALGGRGSSLDVWRRLRAEGWRLVKGDVTTVSTTAYRAFLSASAGEFGIAKHGYVVARSGWFSERSCCYLASGRPVVVQRTGWEDWLPEGDGLRGFSTPVEAVEALEAVSDDLPHHARAARNLVEEHFDAARVCAQLLAAL